MENIFREIKIKSIFTHRHNLNFPAHVHDDIELVYIKKGSGTAYCDGKKYTLTDNSFFIAFPNQVHHYSDCSDGEYIIIVIKPSELYSYADVFCEGRPLSALLQFEDQDDDNAVFLINTALKEHERDGQSPIINAYLTALFGKLLGRYKIEKCRESNDTVLQILQYCKQHYRENVTVSDVAKKLRLSKSSVSHIFSSRICMNFCDYINLLRLSDAEQMLKNKSYPITDIAYNCGFSTIRTFNRAFLKHYGKSPSDYRKA